VSERKDEMSEINEKKGDVRPSRRGSITIDWR